MYQYIDSDFAMYSKAANLLQRIRNFPSKSISTDGFLRLGAQEAVRPWR